MSLQPVAKTREALIRYLSNNFRRLENEVDVLKTRIQALEESSHEH